MDTQRYSKPRAVWQLRKGVGLLTLVVALFSGAVSPAWAGSQEFTIMAVGVSNNSEKADAYALDYARKRAVYLAILKLGVSEAGAKAAKIPEDDWAQIVRGATVVQSKRQGNQTIAEIKVTVEDGPLRKALAYKENAGVIGAVDAVPLRSVLVLPVVVTPKHTFVWEKENALRGPLSSELLRQAHGAVMLPGGDLQDLRLIDGENVAKVTMAELKPMFDRYGAQEIIIALVKPGTLETQEPDKVILRRLSVYQPNSEVIDIPPEKTTDSAQVRMAHTAQVVAQATVEIASSSVDDAQAKLKKAMKIPLHFVYITPRELAVMTDAIRHAPGVLLLELPAITLNNVTGTIYLDGDKTALRKALAAQGIVSRDQGNQWTLSVR